MKRLAILAALALPLALYAAASTASPKVEYVCPMREHPQVFDHPGACPVCGMTLVRRGGRHTVAILMFDGAEAIDYAAPYEVFTDAGYEVFTVGPASRPLRSGLEVTPDYDFAHAPAAEVLVLPGGRVDTGDARIVDWIKARSAGAQVVMSVCNGAFWLAKAGLLDGLAATTIAHRIDELQAAAPKTRVVRDRRWVDNGKIVTTAGLSSGLEGALHVVETLSGEAKARQVALDLEYDWRRDSTWARASLADRWVGSFELGEGVDAEELSSLGDADRWRWDGLLTTRLAPEAVAERLGRGLARSRWTPAGAVRSEAGATTSRWTFRDDQGRAWTGTLHLAPGDAAGQLRATLEWRRDGAPAAR